jgi:aryl-alcohol dehydrogenase-like predicted oxidoreductase
VVIIPGANRAEQVEMNAGAVGWSFTKAELDRLDQVSAKLER